MLLFRGTVGSTDGQDGVSDPSLQRKLERQIAQVCLENSDQDVLTKAGHLKEGNSKRNVWAW